MMLDFLGENAAAQSMMQAMEAVTSEKILTRDLGGDATTKEFTDAVLDKLGHM